MATTSFGLANFKGNTLTDVCISALESMDEMICIRWRMFACVSVMMTELPAWFATMTACDEMNGEMSTTSCCASTNRIGMICVMISALLEMLVKLLPCLI